MNIKETPCTMCRGTGEFKGKYLSDCSECQGTGFMWEMRIERSEEHERAKDNKLGRENKILT